MPRRDANTPEHVRLAEDARREKNWTRWGPYLAERQWGTVREDYSAEGEPWNYFTHEHAQARAYRWGEDGLLGITDRECRLCFALALWNGRDPFLKERLFGLTGPEGNHGEDVKECYFYLDATPTASWLRALYKYPQAEFPYERLRAENRRRGRGEPEFELLDSGVFDGEKSWTGAGDAIPAAHVVVSQHMDVGLPPRGLRGEARAARGGRGARAVRARHAGKIFLGDGGR
jgi:hypothetical protein